VAFSIDRDRIYLSDCYGDSRGADAILCDEKDL
jgi:hypothetical protein